MCDLFEIINELYSLCTVVTLFSASQNSQNMILCVFLCTKGHCLDVRFENSYEYLHDYFNMYLPTLILNPDPYRP
jgi:hypothetical protein